MNIELLNRITDLILEEPRRFNMDQYIMAEEEIAYDHGPEFIPPCGTAACIAGHAMLLTNPDTISPDTAGTANVLHAQASNLLNLYAAQAERLFFAYNWPHEFLTWALEPHTRDYALNAVARIQHFIQTEGRE